MARDNSRQDGPAAVAAGSQAPAATNPVAPTAAHAGAQTAPATSQAQETPEQRAAREEAERKAKDEAEKKGKAVVIVTLRHTTPYERYRRAGLVIGQQPADYRVTQDQFAILKADTWIEVVEK